MEKNVGSKEAALRALGGIIIAAISIFLFYFSAVTEAYAFAFFSVSGIVAAILLLTGVVRHCPINQALGRNTCGE